MTENSKADQAPGSDLRAAYWLYRILPQKSIAYAQLMRLDRPIGTKLLFWPCIWGLLLGFYALHIRFGLFAAPALAPAPAAAAAAALPPAHMRFLPVAFAAYHRFSALGFFLFCAALFYLGALVMRGAGCAYNDAADYKIDAQVARTATRPLPSGRVSRRGALGLTAALCFIGLGALLQFNLFTLILAACSLIIAALYPFVKRFSSWPQAVLGLCFNWGVLVGFAALCGGLSAPVLAVYGGSVCWTIGYDTIYAHQDRDYDARLGMGSTALLFGAKTRAALVLLYGAAFCGWFGGFWAAGGGFWPLFGVFLAGAALLWQIFRFDMGDPASCLHVFKSNARIGWLIALPAFIGLI